MNLSLSTEPFNIDPRPITAAMVSMTADIIEQNTEFSITLELQDEITGEPLNDIAWRVGYDLHSFCVSS